MYLPSKGRLTLHRPCSIPFCQAMQRNKPREGPYHKFLTVRVCYLRTQFPNCTITPYWVHMNAYSTQMWLPPHVEVNAIQIRICHDMGNRPT
jgi:hypothetical protein